jgi:ATP adenylyltransferase
MPDIQALKRLWAPWRLPWIKESSEGVSDCFICDMLGAVPAEDREHLLLHRGNRVSLLMNRYPYTNGHLMVAPNRHLADMLKMDHEEWAETGLLTQIALEALKQTIHPHGFNIGWNLGRISGAGLESHLHQHIVPRWNGDTNFMPVVGQTRVISQDLWECYDLVKEAIVQLRK